MHLCRPQSDWKKEWLQLRPACQRCHGSGRQSFRCHWLYAPTNHCHTNAIYHAIASAIASHHIATTTMYCPWLPCPSQPSPLAVALAHGSGSKASPVKFWSSWGSSATGKMPVAAATKQARWHTGCGFVAAFLLWLNLDRPLPWADDPRPLDLCGTQAPLPPLPLKLNGSDAQPWTHH